MELRQITTFITAAQYGSFTKAAEALGYTQSAVTIQMRLLEEELGTRLFDRMGKHVSLTSKGRQFIEYAYEMINLSNQARASMKDEDELCGSLRIGTIESLCYVKLPYILNHFRQNYPQVELHITTSTPPDLIYMMEHNQVDLIYILDGPRYNNNWHKAMEVPEQIVFVASAASDLSDKAQSSLAELLDQPFFLTEKGANYRLLLDNYLASHGLCIAPSIETTNPDFIIKILKDNKGISFLPYFCVEEHIEAGQLRLINVTDFKSFLYRQIFYMKTKWKTREMDEFIKLAAAH